MMSLKVESSSVLVDNGELYATIVGELLMLLLCVDSLD